MYQAAAASTTGISHIAYAGHETNMQICFESSGPANSPHPNPTHACPAQPNPAQCTQLTSSQLTDSHSNVNSS
jgi:hypothetical protein